MSRRKKPDPPPRRRRDTGSIAKQADGTFWAIPPRWADPGRKPRRGFLTWETAAVWLDEECARVKRGDELPANVTFGEYAVPWFRRMADSADWAPSTRATVANRLRGVAVLTGILLVDLRAGQLQDAVAVLGRRGVSASVITQTMSIVRRILAAAQEDGIVQRNVAARLTLPKVRRPVPRAWTHQEVRRLLDAIEGEPLEPMVGLGLVLGLRIGEILGLTWIDIDFSRTTLTVRQTYSAGQIGPPKTRRERTVRMPDRVWSALLRHRERQALGVPWLFPSPRKPNQPLSYPQARTWLVKMTIKAGIRNLGTHALRHTAATAMLSSGVLPPNAAQQLGHANAGVTLGTYWSPIAGDQDPSDVVVSWVDRPLPDPDTE